MAVTKPKRLDRQQRALEWRREQVLDAAERVFARKGFHEAMMQEIAREAEYATGTLYTLFGNKDEMFAAMVERRLPQIGRHLQEAIDVGRSAREKVEAFVHAFFEFFGSRKHLFQIYINVSGGFLWNVKAELGDQIDRHRVAFLAFLEGVIREGIEAGELRSTLQPRLVAVALVGILTAAATDWITRTPEEPFAALEEGTQELIRTLFAPGARRLRRAARTTRRRR